MAPVRPNSVDWKLNKKLEKEQNKEGIKILTIFRENSIILIEIQLDNKILLII